jgi:hypothetical protein
MIALRGGLLAGSLESRETRLTVVVMNNVMLLKINKRQGRRSLRITKSSMKALALHLAHGTPGVPVNGGRGAVKLHFAIATGEEQDHNERRKAAAGDTLIPIHVGHMAGRPVDRDLCITKLH